MQKNKIRKKLRKSRNELNYSQQLHAALNMQYNFNTLDILENNDNIAVYWALDKEISTTPLLYQLHAQQKNIFLPIHSSHIADTLSFVPYKPQQTIGYNQAGWLQPEIHHTCIEAAQLDIILLPLVGFDITGNRIGMGGGAYDRTLANIQNTKLIGLAYSIQQIPEFSPDPWDVPLDIIVTEEQIFTCNIG